MKAIIMAGGEGSRLRPLTCTIPKPLVPILNRPVMEYTIELLKRNQIEEIGVTLQYLPQEIENWFGDGREWNISLTYFTETNPLGTAGSVKNAESFLDDTFIVISGDALTDFDLQKAIDFHKKKKALVTLILTSVNNPLEYGVVLTHKDGSIDRFLEKPGWGEVFSDQVNTGIYIIEPDVLEYIPSDKPYDFSKDLFPALLHKDLPLFGCLLEGYWCDIGNVSHYLRANHDMLSGKIDLPIQGNYHGNGIWMGERVRLNPKVELKGPIFIGDDVIIDKDVFIDSYSVIGNNCEIGEKSVVKRALLWNNVYLGKYVDLRGSILCNSVVVKSRCQVYENAVIGSHTTIEEQSVVKPGVKIWPNKQIEQGVILNDNLVWGTKANKNIFGTQGVYGISNRDLTPEFAAKLGAAYGTYHKRHDRLVISCDHYKVSQMLKSALIQGLVSTGVDVYDLGPNIMPVHRFAVRSLKVGGGIHIKVDANVPEKIWIQFVDEQGIDLGQGESRKIENIFDRGDFRRVPGQQVGKINYLPRSRESYLDYVIQTVDQAAIRHNRFKAVLVYDRTNLSNTLSDLLDKLGVKTIEFALSFDERQEMLNSFKNSPEILAQQVLNQRANFGVVLDSNGEKVLLLDDKGNLLDEDRLTVLYALIILKTSPGASIVVPVTAPQVVESLAEEYGGRVIRTKTAYKNLLESIYNPDVLKDQGHYNQTVYFDGILTLVKIMEYMAVNRISLSELNQLLPPYHICVDHEYCSWDNKGMVMRRLIQEHQEDQIELLDGLKVKREDGWVLVLPDIEGPRYQIISEGFNQEVAEELTNFYKDKIKVLQS